MAIEKVKIPLWEGTKKDEKRSMTMTEFAGKVVLKISDSEKGIITVRLSKGDFDRGWEAVKRDWM